jgi:hypothetical protein
MKLGYRQKNRNSGRGNEVKVTRKAGQKKK